MSASSASHSIRSRRRRRGAGAAEDGGWAASSVTAGGRAGGTCGGAGRSRSHPPRRAKEVAPEPVGQRPRAVRVQRLGGEAGVLARASRRGRPRARSGVAGRLAPSRQNASSGATTRPQLRSAAIARGRDARRGRIGEQRRAGGRRTRRGSPGATERPAPRAAISSPSASPPVTTDGQPRPQVVERCACGRRSAPRGGRGARSRRGPPAAATRRARRTAPSRRERARGGPAARAPPRARAPRAWRRARRAAASAGRRTPRKTRWTSSGRRGTARIDGRRVEPVPHPPPTAGRAGRPPAARRAAPARGAGGSAGTPNGTTRDRSRGRPPSAAAHARARRATGRAGARRRRATRSAAARCAAAARRATAPSRAARRGGPVRAPPRAPPARSGVEVGDEPRRGRATSAPAGAAAAAARPRRRAPRCAVASAS